MVSDLRLWMLLPKHTAVVREFQNVREEAPL